MITQCFTKVSLALVIPAPKPLLCPCCPFSLATTPSHPYLKTHLLCFSVFWELLQTSPLSSTSSYFLQTLLKLLNSFLWSIFFSCLLSSNLTQIKVYQHSLRKKISMKTRNNKCRYLYLYMYLCEYIYEYISCIHAHTYLYLTHKCVYV